MLEFLKIKAWYDAYMVSKFKALWTFLGTAAGLIGFYLAGFGDFILSLVEHGAWPFVVAFLGWRFGADFLLILEGLANRAEHVRSRWGEVVFRKELEEAKAIALRREKYKPVEQPPEPEAQPNSDDWLVVRRTPKFDVADYLEMAPASRMRFEYQRLQAVVEMQAKRLGVLKDNTPDNERSIPALTLALDNAKIIDHELAETIYRLAEIGSRLARGRPTPRDLSDQTLASDYSNLVDVVVQELSLANPKMDR